MEGNKWGNIVLNFVIRAILGMGLIYFINQYLLPGDNALNVGLNAVSFLTTGSLVFLACVCFMEFYSIKICEVFTKSNLFEKKYGHFKNLCL